MADQHTEEKKISFKDSLNLPHTDFPIRAQPKVDDPALLERWQKEKMYARTFDANKGAKKFILHDGPPYANGHIHLGHAYNKILKDIITKAQRMFGHHVPITPGWDCHGLPIELKVAQENPGLSKHDLKKACRTYAHKWIDIQRAQMKKLGVLMDWDHPYLTMSYEYEASTVRAFGDFVAGGYIARSNKTVPWCPSCQTVLATAEIEYEDRKDPSVYVMFPLEQARVDRTFKDLAGKQVSLLAWTTTPWTLPLNRAILVKPATEYVVLYNKEQYVIVGKTLADALCAQIGETKNVVAEFNSQELEGAFAQHPFVAGLHVPVLLDPSVLIEDGTACVHSAPGCGPEDYEVGIKNNLEIFSPISADGKYTDEVLPAELIGMPVADGQFWVLKHLVEKNKLFFKANIKHSYPHCWRCHGGLIFRATKQWFCDLSRNGLKEKTLSAIDGMRAVPEKSKNRLYATVEGRLEWCLSRQRIWGVPIPAVICIVCDHAFTDQPFIEKIAQGIAKEGIEYWDTVNLADVAPDAALCKKCGSADLRKETDILDVWFDSGVSHTAVLKARPELAFPADMYLEGKDQHRGWFQSSLLTSMVLNDGVAPMKTVMTHGFTVDEKGRKMSKSLGNVVSPDELVDKLGTDGLRLWASSIDCSGEAVISDVLVQNVQEVFRKVRNTCRFLLSNLNDFDIEKDAVAVEALTALDQYALEQAMLVNQSVQRHYANFDLTAVFHELADYCAAELSSFYLDIIKDRLYVEQADGALRRSAQTACWHILDVLTRLMAPVLSFTAEQISDLYQKNKTESIHLQRFAALEGVYEHLAQASFQLYPEQAAPEILGEGTRVCGVVDQLRMIKEKEELWQTLKEMRSAILKALEVLREQKVIKHSLEGRVTLYFDGRMRNEPVVKEFLATLDEHATQNAAAFFKELAIVSEVTFAQTARGMEESELSGFFVTAEHAKGEKCPRCWQWSESDLEHGLCGRCFVIVKK